MENQIEGGKAVSLTSSREERAALRVADAAWRGACARPGLAWIVLALLMLAQAIVLLWFQRGLTFFVDEWKLLAERRDWDVDAFLEPLHEHLFLVPIAIFKVLMATVGIGPHWAYELPLVALHLTSVVLVYALARQRLGAWFALAPAALILFLGSSEDNMLLPIQISFLGSVAAGLGMLLALGPPTTRLRDAGAGILLALSLASSSVGLMFVAIAVVEIVAGAGWRRRIWIALVPLGVYAVWFAMYGPRGLQQGGSVRGNVPFVPGFVADAAAAVFGAIVGLDVSWGRVLAALGVLYVLRKLLRGERLTIRARGLSLALLLFWTLGGAARAHQHNPEASRYLYPAAVFVVLIGVEFLGSVRLSRRWAAVAVAGVVFAAAGNANALRGARDSLQGYTGMLSAQFAALELLGRENVPSDFVASVDLAPGIGAAEYFDTVDDLGSIVNANRDLLDYRPEDRRHADVVLARVSAATARTSPARPTPPGPRVESARFGRLVRSGGCVGIEPNGRGGVAGLGVVARGPAVLIRASGDDGVDISLRRFGDAFVDVIRLRSNASVTLAVPSDGPMSPWRLRLSSRGASEICTVGRPKHRP